MSIPTSQRHQAFLHQSCRCYYCQFPMWEKDPEPFMRQYGLSKAEALLLRCTDRKSVV